MSKYIKIISTIFIVLSIALIIFLIVQDIVWTGSLEFKTDFKNYHPRITKIVPADRIEVNDEIKIIDEPVYFDLYLPRDFEKVIFDFEYKSQYHQVLIGADGGEDKFELKLLGDSLSDQWQNNTVEFDFLGKNIKNGKLRYVISCPGVSAEKPVYIKNLKVKLERPAIWQENIIDNFIKYFNFYRNEIR